jgi:hypothetical protein
MWGLLPLGRSSRTKVAKPYQLIIHLLLAIVVTAMSSSLPDKVPGRSESAPLPPTANTTASGARSPPPSQMHMPINPSPLSQQPRRMSTETQSRSAPAAALRNIMNQLPSGLSSSGKGKGRVLGIQDRLRKEVDGVVKRRQGGVLARG